MISQKQKDEMQQAEHRTSLVEEKQTMTTSEGRSHRAPPSLRRWGAVLLCILGIAMPLVAGSMVSWPWGVGDIFDAEWVLTTVVLAMGVLVSVGVGLLYVVFRTWWAVLFAPVAWVVGEFLGAVVRPLVEGGWPALQAEVHFWDIQSTIIPLAIMPLLVCTLLGAAIGAGINWWLESRKYRH